MPGGRAAGACAARCSWCSACSRRIAPGRSTPVLILFGAARGFSGPSGQSLLPFLVPQERLPRAIVDQFLGLHRGRDRRARRWAAFSTRWDRSRSTALHRGFCVGAALIVSRLGGRRFTPEVDLASRLRTRRRRRALRALASGGAGRDLARSVRGAAGRGDRAAAGLCPRHPACRADRAGLSAQRAGGGRHCRWRSRWPAARSRAMRRQDVRRGGGVRRSPPSCSVCPPGFPCRWRRCSCWAPPTWSASLSAHP